MWYIAPGCRCGGKQWEDRMDNKEPQENIALAQVFPLAVVVNNPPRSLTPAVTNAISMGIKLDELTGNVAVTNADRISSVIIYQSFS